MPGIRLEDLLGNRQEVQVVSARMAKLEGRDALIIVGKDDSGEHRYGVLPDVLQSVLAQGHRAADGSIVLKLPPADRNKRINWITIY